MFSSQKNRMEKSLLLIHSHTEKRSSLIVMTASKLQMADLFTL